MPVYKKCIPDAYVASIFKIDYDRLKKQGVKTLFFDLDNTIIGYDEEILSQTQVDFLKALKKDFKIVIVSNTSQSRVSTAIKALDVPFVYHAKKPLKGGFKKALKLAEGKKEETVLIGDQLMTDIFGAHRFGIQGILVQSVKRKSDRKVTQFNRKLEKIMLKKIKKFEPKLYEERLLSYERDHEM
ncbi:MAG: YqeG family HAD IIIA-type phosphatase [Tenericutes bacterium HGW-Tenericutes-6]|jgi:hypothetical protein|nr:MAG: YqeG family HAD IIIA-type phosphatase [Tenericutes bacterium HGW-Tenericutes-6]